VQFDSRYRIIVRKIIENDGMEKSF